MDTILLCTRYCTLLSKHFIHNRTSWCSGWESCFVFGRYWLRLQVRLPVIWAEICRGFFQTDKTSVVSSRNRFILRLSSSSFKIILPLDTVNIFYSQIVVKRSTWWKTFLEKLCMKFSLLAEVTGLLSSSEKPTVEFYPVPVKTNQYRHTTTLRSVLILSSHPWLCLHSSGFQCSIFHAFISSPMLNPHPKHLIFIDVIILIISVQECKLRDPHYLIYSTVPLLRLC
jgi:hypothetical protein